MAGVIPLDQVVTVSPRFTRSIALVRDFDRPDALEGYVLTPTGRGILARLVEALRDESAARAWSLTGPYGAGKSAFALFVAQLLGGTGEARRQARRLLTGVDPGAAERLFAAGSVLARNGSRLFPVLVSGTREPLEKALAGRLAAALRARKELGRPPAFVPELERLAEQPSPNGSGAAVVGLFEEALNYLAGPGSDGAGLLLIVDELGKFLEYGASYPDRGDVFVLQGLAELAARAPRPFLFLTILHQSFDRYAEHVSPGRRTEWAKVQGRFEDVAFEERTEQVVHLIAQAVGRAGPDPARRALDAQGRELGAEAWDVGLRLGSLEKAEVQAVFGRCFPLHPLVALVVGPLFRQLAQNERTLFAFLTSGESFGLQDYLRQHTLADGQCAPYRLDRLYDYVSATVGPSNFAGQRGKYWGEVQSVIDRLHDAPVLEGRVARVIGLLQAMGSAAGMVASPAVVHFALRGADCSDADIDAALESLCRKSLALFRRHAGCYALFEGSDIDIDAKLEEGRQAVDPGRGLASFLAQQVPPRPLVARRHYLQTGTLRYFEACYAGAEELSGLLHHDLGEADGRVVYCLPLSAEDRQRMDVTLRSPLEATAPGVIAALPTGVIDLREWCHELASLQWFWHHTPELQTDPVARRELRARLTSAENGLKTHLEVLFRPGVGEADRCRWFCNGAEVELHSARELNDYLSRVCQEVYPITPICENELINRRDLSSAAAAARRDLLEAMIEHTAEEGLGLKGAPPEKSMYESVLRRPGLHRPEGDAWGFYPPSDENMAKVWDAIVAFLDQTEMAREPIQRLFTRLGRPPFGIKQGLLPVLLAAVLLHYDAEVALYEDGTFVPKLSSAIIERILRAPGKFEVQRCRISGARSVAFRKYAAMLNRTAQGKAGTSGQMLDVVRALLRVVRQLPDYVAKTRTLSPATHGVLAAIRTAKEPDQMLFTELPKALGFEPFRATGTLPAEQVDAFFDDLHQSLAELQQAYPQLLAEIEALLLKALHRGGPLAKARTDLTHNARLILNLAVDAKLHSFLTRLADDGMDERTWLESMASLLGGKPPAAWDDQDRARFEVNLAASARTFQHFRVLAFEMERTGFALLDGDARMLRISITVPNEGEVERVVQMPPHLIDKGKQAKEDVRRILEENHLLDKKEVGIALLAQLARQLLSESEQNETQS